MLSEPFTDRYEAIALFELLRGRDPDKPWPRLPILTFLAPGGGGKSTLIEYLRAKQCHISTEHAALPYALLDFTLPDAPKTLLSILVGLRNQLQQLDDGQGRSLTFPRFDLGAAIALATPTDGSFPQLSQDKIVPSLTAALPFFQSMGEMGNALGNIVPFIPPLLVELKWVAQIPPLKAIIQLLESGPGWKWYRTHTTDVGLLANASIEDVLRRLYALSMPGKPGRQGREHLVRHLLPAAFLEDLRDALDTSQSAWSRTANVVLFLDGFEELLKDKDPNNTGIQLLEMLTERYKHGETTPPLLLVIGSRQRLFPHSDTSQAIPFEENPPFQRSSTVQYEYIAEKHASELALAEQQAQERARELYESWQRRPVPNDMRFLRLEHLYLPLWLQDFEPVYTCNYVLEFGKQEQISTFASIDNILVRTINDVTHGHPLCLALVAAAMMEAQASGQPLVLDGFLKIKVPSYPCEIAEGNQNELIKNYLLPLFLRQLSESEQKDLIFCAVPRTLDIDTLQAVLPHLDDIEVQKRWERYCRFTFVRTIDDKRIALHPILRDLLSYQLPPTGQRMSTYHQVHALLLKHFAKRAFRGEEIAQVEEAYHALALGDPEPAIRYGVSALQHNNFAMWDLLQEVAAQAPTVLKPDTGVIRQRISETQRWASSIQANVTVIVLYTWGAASARPQTIV